MGESDTELANIDNFDERSMGFRVCVFGKAVAGEIAGAIELRELIRIYVGMFCGYEDWK